MERRVPHLVLRVNRQSVAISIEVVREILIAPVVTPLPGAPVHLRGLIDVRGEVMPVIDLRRRLGTPSLAEETAALVQLLEARQADHRKWIDELEACVREHRSFTLARDPHRCAFGKWYDVYQPDNVALEFIWSGFDRPHREIHALADVVLGLAERGETERALEQIERSRRGALAARFAVFEEAKRAVAGTSRELAIVLSRDGETVAITADAAEAVEDLDEGGLEALPSLVGEDAKAMFAGTADRDADDGLTLILDVAGLFAERPGERRASAAA